MMSTIALGAEGGRSSGKPLSMWGWNWDNNRNPQTFYQQVSGESNITEHIVSWASNRYRDGGEMNQLTGEIYFTGATSSRIGYEGQTGFDYSQVISIWNPVTGATAWNTGWKMLNEDLRGWYTGTDNAIDAEGNMYIIARNGNNAKLVKVEIPRDASGSPLTQDYFYSVITDFGNVGYANNIFGMGFFNGLLYVTYDGNRLYTFNTLTGEVIYQGSAPINFFDLASCQVAPVIRGRVYKDEEGLGNITDSMQGLSDIAVEIWRGDEYVGETRTDSNGQYSFLVDSTKGSEFNIVISKPEIDGVPAVQTWAGSNNPVKNPVDPFCMNAEGVSSARMGDGFCRGNNLNYSEALKIGVEKAYIRTRVIMNSDEEVAYANFALTAVKNNSTSGTSPVYHIAPGVNGSGELDDNLNFLRLGDKVFLNGQNPDGVEYKNIDGDYVPLANDEEASVFLVGNTYDLRVKVSGAQKALGHLGGWINWGNSGSLTGYPTAFDIGQNISSDGYYNFKYTVPAGSVNILNKTSARFRVSTRDGLTATSQAAALDGQAWAIDGEVEDYNELYLASGAIYLRTKSLGGTDTFHYKLSNISTITPSVSESSITTIQEDQAVRDKAIHVYERVGQDIVITQTSESNPSWNLIEAECTIDNRPIDVTLTNGSLTVSGTSVIEGKAIICTLTNSLGPRLGFTKEVGNRYKAEDQFTIQIKDGETVAHSATTVGTETSAEIKPLTLESGKTYILTEVMAGNDQVRLNRYDATISCTNSAKSSKTVLPSGGGKSFSITPTNGDNISCSITNTTVVPAPDKSTIVAEPPSIEANGSSTSTITVQVVDSNGKPILAGGDTVEIYFTNESDHKGFFVGQEPTVSRVVATDNNDGTHSIEVASNQTWSEESFSYTVNGEAGNGNALVSYTAGAVSIESSVIEVAPEQITANGEDFATITVTLRDANNNQLANSIKGDSTQYDVSIHFVDDANKIGSITEFKDNEDGTFTAKVSSTVIGSEAITFTVDAATSSQSKPITYVAAEASLTNSKIEANPEKITADGKEKAILKVTLYDAENNIITNGLNPTTEEPYVVEIHFVKTDGTIGTLTATNKNDDGSYTAEVSSEKAGSDEFDFTLDGEQHAGPVSVTYIAGTANKDASTIAIEPKSITADGADTATITVTLFDANNNQLTTGSDLEGNPYTVEIFSTEAAGSTKGDLAESVTNNNDGTFTITLTSKVKGNETFGFSLNSERSSKTDNITYTPGSVDLSQSTIVAVPNEVVADGDDFSIITVQLKDAQGNNLNSNIGTVSITGLVLPVQAGEKVAATYIDEGRYELKVTSVRAGLNNDINFEVTVDGSAQAGQGEKASIDFIPGPVDLNQSTITANPTAIVANGEEISTITVQLKDSQGNNLRASNGTVTLIFNDGAGTQGTVTDVVDNQDGTYTATIKSTVANVTDKVNFALDGAAASATPAHIQYNPGEVSLETSTITANPKTIEANGTAESTVTVQLKDSHGNDIKTPLSNGVITLTTNGAVVGTVANNGQLSYSGDGKYIVTVTSDTTGSDTFGYNISNVGDGVNTETITYRTGGISLTESTLDVAPIQIVADGTDAAIVSVQLLDANKNKPEEMPGVVYLTGLEKGKTADGSLQMTHVGNGLYQITVTSIVAGVDHLGYEFGETEDSRAAGSAKKDLTYVAGEVSLVESTIVINPSSITANGQARANVTVQLRDANQNLITDNKGSVTLVGLEIGNLLNAENNALTFQGGSYTGIITSTKTGTENVGFTLEGVAGNSEKTAPITYVPGNVSNSLSEISADPLSIVADDEEFTTITIQLKDGQGNNLDSEIAGTIALTGVVSGHIAEAIHYVGEGAYQATVKSQKAGVDNIGFTINNNPGQNGTTIAVTYTAGDADLSKSTLTANPVEIVANGTTTSTLTVQLYDAFGNKITEARDNVVVISIKEGSTTEATLTETVKGTNGTYTARVSSNKSGVDHFDFSLDGVQANITDVAVTYTAGSAVAANSVITADPKEILADGTVTSTLTVQLRDANNNDLTASAGDIVRIVSESNPVLGVISAITDNNDGTYSATVTSIKAGVESFGFTVSGAKSTSTDSVTYLPGAASATTSEIAVQPAVITADGETPSTVTVTLRDINGNKLISNGNGAAVVLKGVLIATEGNITLTYDGGETGTFSGTLTSTTEGADTIGFTLNGTEATGSKATAVLTYRSGGYDLNTSTITLSKPEITADMNDSSVVTITIVDKNGNAVSDDLTIALTGLDNGQLVSALVKEGNVYTGTIISNKTGEDNIGFTIDGSAATGKETLKYVAGDYDFSKSTISVNPTSIVANDVQTALVTVQLRDKYDNNLDRALEETVSLVADSLVFGKSAEASESLNFAYMGNGRYELRVKSINSGTDQLNYQVGTSINSGAKAALTYTAGPISLDKTTIVADPDSIVADGTEQSTITVQFKDAFDNDITTNVGTVSLNGFRAGAGLVGSMQYAGAGKYIGKVASTKTGTDHIGFTIDGVGSGDQTAELTYTAGEVDIDQSTISAQPNTIDADGVATSLIVVQLRDAKGNIVPTDNGLVVLVGLDLGEVAADMTFIGNGRYEGRVKSTTSGTDTLSFTLAGGDRSKSQTTVTYKPGKYDLSTSEISVNPASIEANGNAISTVTVQLKDKFGNDTEDGAAVNVVLTGLNIGKIDNPQLTFKGNGLYTGVITSIVAGSETLSFTVDNDAPSADNPKGKATITYTAGSADPSISTITATPRRILADGTAISTITVQLKDSNGNNLADNIDPTTKQPYTVDLSFVGEHVGVMNPVSGEMTHIGNGAFTLTVSSKVAGTDKFTFAVNSVTPDNKLTNVTYYSGEPDAGKSTIVASKPTITADGVEESILTVTLMDAEGNIVDPSKYPEAIKATVVISPQEVTEGVSVSAVTPVGDGTYTATVRSTVAKTDTFEFTFDGAKGTDTASVEYVAGAVDGSHSSITITPDKILANGVETAEVTIILRDANENIITSNVGSVNLTGLVIGSAAQSQNLVMGEDGSYKTTISSILPGKEDVGFEVVGSTGTTPSVTPAPIEYTLENAVFDDGKSTIVTNPKSITADGSDKSIVTVTLKHEGTDTPLSGLGINELTLVSKKEGQADLIGDVTPKGETGEGTGIYTFEVTSLLLGDDLFAFALNGTTSTKTDVVEYTTGGDIFDPEQSSIAIDKTEIVADGEEFATITVTLKYESGAPVIGATTLTLIPFNDGETLIGQIDNNNQAKDNGDGTYTFTVRSESVVGKDTFGYRTSSTTGTNSVDLTYTTGGDAFDPTRSTIVIRSEMTPENGETADILADGIDAATVTVTLKYKSGVPMTGAESLVLNGVDNGTVSPVKDNQDGTYTFTVVSANNKVAT
ncbi:invasin domain 3-containing protein, partial [Ignatzschineria larvae]